MNNSGWSHTESPFHPGELAVQARLGIQDRIDRQGRRIIRDYLTEQHQKFFAQLSYVIIGTVDKSGNPWASILVGEPGFLEVIGDRKLQVKTKLLTGDPLAVTLNEGIDIGLLGIELHTRRRNRINGVVTKINADNFEIEVKQAFGNCPQYIQGRTFESVKSNLSPQINEITSFGECERNLITNADTFFIATAYQDEFASNNTNKGVDVSHKGGKPSFVRIDNNQTLTIPDFSGNNHFNTIGNLELNPRAGLLFIDFARSNLLYLTGTTEIIWSGTEVSSYQGAERLIRFHLTQGYQVENSLPLSWSNPKSSKFLDQTGSW
ncbi:Pyridoxamine 5'-phosphate oxidase-related, FMN binding [Hyella patelloides LEGE 07179]|uniref:Pyridoxamine 5'-phosphate oxidase-related, FMN binding n=1 Tax=Hyella patelloides LEGE 07179 TaxID=945734 RepID=A0A563VLK2_9CYAN|nr:pyridoxamine 5'-phosphate oxidase family protein [Hyella patelloides]VEP12330.1 Pyridoxamine 5'-phosphate oxidase-related, FMN binding [Hyella patelloides LEGE 07179]